MARKRVIDTGLYFDTEICKLLGPRGLHLYIRLWGIAEDWGGYEANYEDIALQMGALKFTIKEAKKFIESLISTGKIVPYDTGNGRIYHWLKNFSKHQPLNNPGPPRLPLPEWISCELKTYQSGKTYAKYGVITEKLPVGYQYTTSNVETETKRNETETKRKLYGEFENVMLSDEERSKLISRWDEKTVCICIEEFGTWMKANGKTKKDHYASLLSWIKKHISDNKTRVEKIIPINKPRQTTWAQCPKCGKETTRDDIRKFDCCPACHRPATPEQIKKLIGGI